MRKYKGGVNSLYNTMKRKQQQNTRHVNFKEELENLAKTNPIKPKTANRIQKELRIIAANIHNQAWFNSDPPPPDWLLNNILKTLKTGGKSKTRKHRSQTK